MASYNIYLQDGSLVASAKTVVEGVVGVTGVRIVHGTFMPPCVRFTTSVLNDDGVNAYVVQALINQGFAAHTFIVLKPLHTRTTLM